MSSVNFFGYVTNITANQKGSFYKTPETKVHDILIMCHSSVATMSGSFHAASNFDNISMASGVFTIVYSPLKKIIIIGHIVLKYSCQKLKRTEAFLVPAPRRTPHVMRNVYGDINGSVATPTLVN